MASTPACPISSPPSLVPNRFLISLSLQVGVYAHKDIKEIGDEYFKVYQPCAGDSLHPPDDGYIAYGKDGILHVDEEVTKDTVAWWMMACGRTMGMLNGMLVEYDSSTLAPLGLIVGAGERTKP